MSKRYKRCIGIGTRSHKKYDHRHGINNGKAKLRVQCTPRSIDYVLAILLGCLYEDEEIAMRDSIAAAALA